MAGKYGSPSFAVFLIDGYNIIANKLKSVAEATESMTEPSHGLGDSWEEHTPTGMQKAELAQEGALFDDDTNKIHDAMSGNEGVSRVTCYGFEGNTIGARATGLVGALAVAYARMLSLGGLHKANVRYLCSGQKDEGRILHAHSAETAAGNTEASSVDNSASSADGGVGISKGVP